MGPSPGTIFALSSGAPPAAIAIVRVSGPGADAALEALAGALPQPRRAALRELRDPGSGELLDRGLVLRFPGPASATGEDLVELHLHGGRSVVAGVLEALGECEGLRAAEPGEFTRRAFGNGRIDLAQAEGLADLLAAETASQRRAALTLAGGALGRLVEGWRSRLLSLAADVEMILDFSDSDEDVRLPADWGGRIADLSGELEGWLATPPAERLRDGVRIIVAGPPNAGKSTLVNALSGREAAITSDIAGTTRDVIEVPIAIGGVPMLLLDTAGLRNGSEPLEQIGIRKAERAMADADLILWLGDPDTLPEAPARTIRVHPKSDLEAGPKNSEISVSAITGAGMEELRSLLIREVARLLPAEGELAISSRHRGLIAATQQNLSEAVELDDEILVAEALRSAMASLGAITGRSGVEELLGDIFSRFCIGK